jgi:hypothetical protein
MFATLLTITLFIASAFADIYVPTLSLSQCKDVHFTWADHQGPFTVALVSPEDPCGDPIKDLGDHDSNSITWKCNLPAGTKVELSVVNAKDEGWSGTMTVEKSDDPSCLQSNNAAQSSSSSATVTLTSSTQAPLPTTSSDSGSGSGSGSGQPVGAANAGNNPLSSGTLTLRQISNPVMAVSIFLAAFAITL